MGAAPETKQNKTTKAKTENGFLDSFSYPPFLNMNIYKHYWQL